MQFVNNAAELLDYIGICVCVARRTLLDRVQMIG